jgi:hypothetical protein
MNPHFTRLFIDDMRNPPERGWAVARSSREAIGLLQVNGCPKQISFDHDLGGDDTAMVVVKWMIERDLDGDGKFIPTDFTFRVHSANPVGKANIEGLLDAYLRQRTRTNRTS